MLNAAARKPFFAPLKLLYNKHGHRILTGEELTRYKQQGFFKHAG